MARCVERQSSRVGELRGHLRALSPQATLDRGYAIVRLGGTALKDTSAVTAGTLVDVELRTGGFAARVEEVRG
jgi:exodeoxyribonuclease VII large subunit